MRNIEVKAKLLGVSKTVYKDQRASAYGGESWKITYCGFDTLGGYERKAESETRQSYVEIQAEATRNVAGGMTLDKRVKEVLRSLNLGPEIRAATALTLEQCKTVCMSGLVVELLFLPYAGLRDYVTVACIAC